MSEIGNELFDEVLAVSGLSSVFGTKALARAFQRAGIDPHALTKHDLARSLPTLEQALSVFLKPAEVQDRLRAISELHRRAPS